MSAAAMGARECGACVFFHPLGDGAGQCRRNPPRIILTDDNAGQWPLVSRLEWCGGYASEWPATGPEAAAAAARAYLGSVLQLTGLGGFSGGDA